MAAPPRAPLAGEPRTPPSRAPASAPRPPTAIGLPAWTSRRVSLAACCRTAQDAARLLLRVAEQAAQHGAEIAATTLAAAEAAQDRREPSALLRALRAADGVAHALRRGWGQPRFQQGAEDALEVDHASLPGSPPRLPGSRHAMNIGHAHRPVAPPRRGVSQARASPLRRRPEPATGGRVDFLNANEHQGTNMRHASSLPAAALVAFAVALGLTGTSPPGRPQAGRCRLHDGERGARRPGLRRCRWQLGSRRGRERNAGHQAPARAS